MTLASLEHLFLTIFEITLTASVVIAAMFLLTSLFAKKYTAKWRRWAWIVIALRLIIPFNISLPRAPIILPEIEREISWLEKPEANYGSRGPVVENVSAKKVLVSHNAGAIEVLYMTPSGQYLPCETSPGQLPPDYASFNIYSDGTAIPTAKDAIVEVQAKWFRIEVSQVLALIWLAGVVCILSYHTASHLHLRKSLRRWSKPVTEEHILAALEEAKRNVATTHYIRIQYCKKTVTPMLTGILHPTILLPEREYGGELAMILSHELLHYKHHDIVYKLLGVLAACIHWFNPLVWLMVKEMDRVIEIACDEAVVDGKSFACRREYGEILLDSVVPKAAIMGTSFGSGKQTMLHRLKTILDTRAKERGAAALAAVVAISFFASSLVSCGQPEIPQQNKKLTIYVSNSVLRQAVDLPLQRFRQKFPEIEVELTGYGAPPSYKDYSPDESAFQAACETYYGNSAEFTQDLATQMSSPKESPDLILFDDGFFEDTNKAIASGLFAEMDGLLASDSSYRPELYRQSMLKAGQFRGKQYTIPLFAHFNSIISTQKMIEGSLFQYIIDDGDFSQQFCALTSSIKYDNLFRENSQLFFDQRFPLQWEEYAGIQILDYENNRVKNLNSYSFRGLQENLRALYSRGQMGVLPSFPAETQAQAVLSGDAQFALCANAFSALSILSGISAANSPVLMPIRSQNAGIQGTVDASAAIGKYSENRHLAYEFIKLLMGKEFQLTREYLGLIPLYAFDEDIRISLLMDQFSYHRDAQMLPEDFYQKYVSLENQVNSFQYPSSASSTLYEAFLPYYQSESSYEECLRTAQDQLTEYLRM